MRHDMIGKWRLIEMEQWDHGFVAFGKGGQGEMRFGAVSLNLDWVSGDDGKAEFSFEGFDEMDEVSGRGWAKIVAGRLTGLIKFHQGDESGFTAEPWNAAKKLKRKRHRKLLNRKKCASDWSN